MNEQGSLFLFAGPDLLLPRDGGPSLPLSLAEGLRSLGVRRYNRDGKSWEARALDEAGAEQACARSLERVPVRAAIGKFDDATMRPALQGLALLHWLEGALRCGACGAELRDDESSGPDAGSRRCPACGRAHFPRISPAVIVLVHHEGRALLARNARFPSGRFGLLAGFVEAGETLEEAAVREIREEAGIEIRDLRYRRSQPWPFPDSLMVAFTAEWAGGEARADGEEIVELRWCAPDELPDIPPPGSVARSLIDDFVSGRIK